MIKFEKFWLIVILCSFLVGVFYATPQFFIWNKLNKLEKTYETAQITHRGDIIQSYLPRAREVYDGHFPPADLHVSSYLFSGLNTVTPPIPPLIFSLLLKINDGNINLSFLLAELIFPVIIFIFAYILGIVLFRKKKLALLFSFLWTLTPLAIHLPKAFSSLENFLNIAIKNFYPLVNTNLDKLFLDRIDDPFLTYPFLIIALTSVFIFWEKPQKITAIFMGSAIGLLAYVYFHYWVYLTIVLGLIFLWNVFIDRNKNKQRFKNGVIVIFVFILVISPYVYNYYKFSSMESAKDYIGRIGIEHGRFLRLFEPFSILFDYTFYVIISALIYLTLFKKGNKERAILYWIFVIGMFLVWNIQLIIGYVPHPDHWFKTISPAVLIIVFDLVCVLLKDIDQKKVGFFIFILICLLFSKKIVNIINFIEPESKFISSGESELTYSFDKNIYNSWNWINHNLRQEPKILSDSFLSSFYMLSHTSVRPFLMTWYNTLTSNDEIKENFLISNKIFKVSSDIVYERLKGGFLPNNGDRHTVFNKIKGSQHAFGNFFKSSNLNEFRYMDKDYANLSLVEYGNMENVGLENIGEYIYYGPWEKQFSSIDFRVNSVLELVFKNDFVEIYKIKK